MKKRILKLLIILFLIGLIAIIYGVLFKLGIVIPCVFHEITGLYCPGCGITRMILSILKLDFYQAFRYNNLIFVFLPLILVYVCDFLIKWIKSDPNYLYKKTSDKIWFILLIITLLFGVFRNVPAFDYLIPTIV